jgi:iron complex outermembrane recepter protein
MLRSHRRPRLVVAGLLGLVTQTITGAAIAAETGSEHTPDTVTVQAARERSVNLTDVVTTGSRLGLETKDLPASVSVVTQELIQLTGARTALESIQSAVGMTGSTGVGSIPSYTTRGFTGSDITIMRDGIRQNTSSQASRPLDSFLFERIEVLKGPASLLYGEGAVGGAVNYVSKTAPTRFTGEAYASGGSWDTYRAGLGLGGPSGIDDVYYRFDASHNSSNGYVDRSEYDYNAFAGDVRWEISDRTSLSLSASLLTDDTTSYYGTPLVYDAIIDQNGVQAVRRANTLTDTLVNPRIVRGTERLNYNIADNFVRGQNGFYRLIFQTRIGDNLTLRNEAYAATQNLMWRNAESTVWNPATQLVERGSFLLIYRNDLQLGDRLDLTWDSQIAGHTNRLLVGALYDNNDQVRNTGQPTPTNITPVNVPLTGFDPGVGPAASFIRTVGVVTETSAVYIEDVFEPTDNLKLIGGLRYDRIDVERESFIGAPFFSKSYSPVTGRVGVVYSLTPDSNLYASYSKAAQPVSQLVSLLATQADFSLQKGAQLEVGVKTSLWNNLGDLTVAVYDIKKKDLLTSTIVDDVRLNSQIGAQVSQGAEVALSLAPASGWRVEGNLAYTWKAEYEDFNENLGTGVISRSGKTTTGVPDLVAGLFVVHNWTDWSVNAGLRHVAARWANTNNSIKLDSYTTLDAAIVYRYGPVVATLRGRNLTDELYTSGSSALAPRLEDPRSAELNLKYSF